MSVNYNNIIDISYLSSSICELEEIKKLYKDGFFSRIDIDIHPDKFIQNIDSGIDSRLKTRMSQVSLGVTRVLQDGGAKNIVQDDEIYLFSSFAEIETTNKIIYDITINDNKLVSPSLFHNSVHNTPLGYYTIIKKLNNYCSTISDGLETGMSFCNFIKYRTLLDGDFVVVAGDEWSDFFKLDKFNYRDIYPIFISYKIVKDSNKGFRYLNSFTGYDNLLNQIELNKMDNIIVPHTIYNDIKVKNIKNINILNDRIISFDSPTSIINRLALPFIIELKGSSWVIDQYNDLFYIFEVIL